jgi:hypothetical protein
MQFCEIKMIVGWLGICAEVLAIPLLLLESACSRLCYFFHKFAFDGDFLRGGLYFSCY